MSTERIETDFKSKVSEQIRLTTEGIDRYRVFTPFKFEDGDHFAIVLKRDGARWILSDEANTYMRLTYDIDEERLYQGTRQRVISDALALFDVEDRDGELILAVHDERYGDSLYSFVQALMKVSDISFLSRERARTVFMDDFHSMFAGTVPEERRSFDWYDTERDPQGMYRVDCRINGMSRPLFVHALASDGKTRDATITLLQFERWNVPFRSLAIFQDQESINRKVLARFSDVCEKQFSSISGDNYDRIERYVGDLMNTAGN